MREIRPGRKLIIGTTADGRRYWSVIPVDVRQGLWNLFYIATATLDWDAEHGCKTVKVELHPQ